MSTLSSTLFASASETMSFQTLMSDAFAAPSPSHAPGIDEEDHQPSGTDGLPDEADTAEGSGGHPTYVGLTNPGASAPDPQRQSGDDEGPDTGSRSRKFSMPGESANASTTPGEPKSSSKEKADRWQAGPERSEAIGVATHRRLRGGQANLEEGDGAQAEATGVGGAVAGEGTPDGVAGNHGYHPDAATSRKAGKGVQLSPGLEPQQRLKRLEDRLGLQASTVRAFVPSDGSPEGGGGMRMSGEGPAVWEEHVQRGLQQLQRLGLR
jgi:hypothetical protein